MANILQVDFQDSKDPPGEGWYGIIFAADDGDNIEVVWIGSVYWSKKKRWHDRTSCAVRRSSSPFPSKDAATLWANQQA